MSNPDIPEYLDITVTVHEEKTRCRMVIYPPNQDGELYISVVEEDPNNPFEDHPLASFVVGTDQFLNSIRKLVEITET